ncbi:MAG TPA: tetratricopeptide repeat protein [Candidatus Acidoferrales bacterium]
MTLYKKTIATLLLSCSLYLYAQPICAATRAVALQTPQSNPSVDSARRLFDAGNYTAAITALKSAIAQNANNADAHYWLGRSYYEAKDLDNAVAEGERSIALDAKNSDYHRWLGEYYGEQADRQHSFFLARKVKREFEEAVKLNPSNIKARRDLEEFEIQAPGIVGGNKDDAKAQVDAIAAIDPVEGHLARAVYDQDVLKKADLVEKEYQLTLDAHPAKIDPYLEIADVYRQLSRPADMGLALAAAEKVKPGDPRIGFYRAVQRILANNQPSSAEPLLKSYLATTPDRSDWPTHAAARYWLGRVYEQQGKRQEASEQYRAALQLDSTYKDARTRLQALEKNSK